MGKIQIKLDQIWSSKADRGEHVVSKISSRKHDGIFFINTV